MTENKRYKYYEEENGEFPFPSIKTDDGKTIVSLYECYDLLNEQEETIQNQKGYILLLEQKLEENGIRLEEIQRLKKELKNRKKMNNILEGFLLDKGYDLNDILKFLQDRTENGDVE